MPAIKQIADLVTLTLPTIERGKWDSVGLAQLYPKYEAVTQLVGANRMTRDSSYLIDTALEISAPSSYEHSYSNHPAETATHQLAKRIQTPLVKVRTKMTFSDDEKELQGASAERLVDIVQMRTTKWNRDFWEGLEHDLISAPTGPEQHPDRLRGFNYWFTGKAGIAAGELDMHGGDDPTGFTAGAGGITKAQEPLWPNAVAKFVKVSQFDFFDKLSQFINRRKLMAVVPHPQVASEVPNEVIYVQEPVKRACERYFTGANDQVGNDGATYRDANYYRSMPITIWHAMSSPESPVRPSVCTVKLVDWNSIMYQVHSAFDQKITGPVMLPHIPGQFVTYNETWHGLHCTRRDRNLVMTSDTPELQPSAT